MAHAKTVQMIPAGARQVSPGVYQMSKRRSGGGGKRHHHKGGRRHFQASSFLSGSAIRFVKLMNQLRPMAKNFNAPAWINVPAALAYMYGQSKKDKGVMNIAKAYLIDSAVAGNPSLAPLLMSGGGDMMGMLGLMGMGTGAKGPPAGLPTGGPPGTNFQSGTGAINPSLIGGVPGAQGGGATTTASDINAAAALTNALSNV